MKLKLAIFVDPTHQADDQANLLVDVERLLPDAHFVEDLDHAGIQRVLTYELEEKPALAALERVDHLDWVATSEGTAWTGPVPEPAPRSGSGQCPFAAAAASMSEEEMAAFLDEHRANQSGS